MANPIVVCMQVRVGKYRPNAVFDDYENRAEAFGVVGLTIISPPERAGRTLAFMHAKAPGAGSPWLDEGGVHSIEIAEEDLDPNLHLFEGAVKFVPSCPK